MKKWNEVNYEVFKELIITDFLNKKDWTLDKVLELQDPINPNKRCYLMNCLGEDLRNSNIISSPLLDYIKEVHPDIDCNKGLSLVRLHKKQAKLAPIIGIEGFSSLLSSFFGKDYNKEPLNNTEYKWYVKTPEGNRVVDLRKNSTNNYSPNERYIRVRTIGYNLWKDNLTNHLVNNEELVGCNQDMKFNQVT